MSVVPWPPVPITASETRFDGAALAVLPRTAAGTMEHKLRWKERRVSFMACEG